MRVAACKGGLAKLSREHAWQCALQEPGSSEEEEEEGKQERKEKKKEKKRKKELLRLVGCSLGKKMNSRRGKEE